MERKMRKIMHLVWNKEGNEWVATDPLDFQYRVRTDPSRLRSKLREENRIHATLTEDQIAHMVSLPFLELFRYGSPASAYPVRDIPEDEESVIEYAIDSWHGEPTEEMEEYLMLRAATYSLDSMMHTSREISDGDTVHRILNFMRLANFPDFSQVKGRSEVKKAMESMGDVDIVPLPIRLNEARNENV
jgi:hypothetical protein